MSKAYSAIMASLKPDEMQRFLSGEHQVEIFFRESNGGFMTIEVIDGEPVVIKYKLNNNKNYTV